MLNDCYNCANDMNLCMYAQSCPTLCDPMDCSLPGFSDHEIFQARILSLKTMKCGMFNTNLQNTGILNSLGNLIKVLLSLVFADNSLNVVQCYKFYSRTVSCKESERK